MEGPSITILVEELQKFIGARVTKSSGSSKLINIKSLKGQKLTALTSWGKHFLMTFEKVTLKIHFMLFGTYRIDEARPGMTPRLALTFRNGEFCMYACSIRELHEPLSRLYDWRADLMSESWAEDLAVKKLQKLDDRLICDALLSQEIFAGAGNIIKNEVLFRMKLHPDTKLGALSDTELQLLARETELYSLQFYLWKKQYLLKKNWEIYRKSVCPRCEGKVRMKPTGAFERRSFFCPRCQKLRRRRLAGQVHIRNVERRKQELSRKITSLRKELRTSGIQGKVEREH